MSWKTFDASLLACKMQFFLNWKSMFECFYELRRKYHCFFFFLFFDCILRSILSCHSTNEKLDMELMTSMAWQETLRRKIRKKVNLWHCIVHRTAVIGYNFQMCQFMALLSHITHPNTICFGGEQRRQIFWNSSCSTGLAQDALNLAL